MLGIFLGLVLAVQAQTAAGVLDAAYAALREGRYDEAIAGFRKAIEADPARAATYKDLAYSLLKAGETEAARDAFAEAMRLAPEDLHTALEYAFLCNETKERVTARRVFDQVRKAGDPASRKVAEQAFQNIDVPLREGIRRWRRAIEMGADDFSAHHELAQLAELRDELELAALHYRKAWERNQARRSVLVELGRVLQGLDRRDEATAALLAASRGGEPRAAENARALMPARYPYVYEFRNALALDASNIELRRELAYLLLRMNDNAAAEEEFRILIGAAPDDLLSATQLGFLYLARDDKAQATPLLQRVLNGKDVDLANRVRAVLRLPQTPESQTSAKHAAQSLEAKLMAERSIKAGYMKDALRYLKLAHDADPIDFSVMLQLGWTYNILRDDNAAIRWFELARKSPDPVLAVGARNGYRNLRLTEPRIAVSGWVFPMYSSRWKNLFSYSQIKTEWSDRQLPFNPYVSMRFIGDVRSGRESGDRLRAAQGFYSESAVVAAVGIATRSWKGAMLWGEAGEALQYASGHAVPDYRGGLAYGKFLGSEGQGWMFDHHTDAIFISRFRNDFLFYGQNRFGHQFAPVSGWAAQGYWNVNIVQDAKREGWANFFETGPGMRFRWVAMPKPMFVSVDLLRGYYTVRQTDQKPHYFDLRTGFWYAFSR